MPTIETYLSEGPPGAVYAVPANSGSSSLETHIESTVEFLVKVSIKEIYNPFSPASANWHTVP